MQLNFTINGKWASNLVIEVPTHRVLSRMQEAVDWNETGHPSRETVGALFGGEAEDLVSKMTIGDLYPLIAHMQLDEAEAELSVPDYRLTEASIDDVFELFDAPGVLWEVA